MKKIIYWRRVGKIEPRSSMGKLGIAVAAFENDKECYLELKNTDDDSDDGVFLLMPLGQFKGTSCDEVGQLIEILEKARKEDVK